MVETARVQSVFLDVVGFTRNRSVEAQSDVVDCLNSAVKSALVSRRVTSEQTVLLPTGDGMAIALINVTGFDLQLQLALEILRLISLHNAATTDPMRRFEVRIGINENVDNVLRDINDRRNVAGVGISMAQRIMDQADGGQILIGHGVYETLRQREKYLASFKMFTATAKHGVQFPVYQFIGEGNPGLNTAPPSAFAESRLEPIELTKFVAYYLAHAARNRSFLMSRKDDAERDYAAIVLLTFLAEDSEEVSDTPPHAKPFLRTWEAGKATFEEQYSHYYHADPWLIAQCAILLRAKNLQPHSELFESSNGTTNYLFVTRSGILRLVTEWPQVASEFGIAAAP